MVEDSRDHRHCLPCLQEALTASAVQEQLHRVDVRREEVGATL